MNFFDGVTPQAVANAPDGFKEFRIGDNDAYIKMVQEKISRESGNPMLEITFADEEGAEIKYYIVDGEYKLSRLKQLYDAFGIPPNEYASLGKWLYKEGVVVCKPGEPYNGKVYNKVSYVHQKFPGQGQTPDRSGHAPQNGTSANSPSKPPMQLGCMTQQGQGQLNNEFNDDIPF